MSIEANTQIVTQAGIINARIILRLLCMGKLLCKFPDLKSSFSLPDDQACVVLCDCIVTALPTATAGRRDCE
jgi:hypothetical protein